MAYEDFHDDLARFERLLADVAKASSQPLVFRLASGTYGDLVHWLDRGHVDIAVVTPGLIAEGFAWHNGEPGGCRFQYLGTLAMPAATSPFAADDRRRPGRHTQYRAICLARRDSSLRTIGDLRRKSASGGVRFLFVDPLSVSGSIAPLYALRQAGVEISAEQVHHTASHSNSVRALLQDESGREKVAFVWDEVSVPEKDVARLRVLDFPKLAALTIPQGVVVAREGFRQAAEIQTLLSAARPDEFQTLADWQQRYVAVRRWMSDVALPSDSDAAQQISLAQLGAILVHDARSQPQPPRVALVLSGGGAKCAYQVGAVAALEEELARVRSHHPGLPIDLGLVVGTSGGAINSLPVALGLTASQAGRQDVKQVWLDLDQRDIVRPSILVRGNMGVWFALIQIALVLGGTAWYFGRDARRARAVAWTLLLALGLAELAVVRIPWTPWHAIGDNHILQHAWLWGTFGARGSAWVLLGLCAIHYSSRVLPKGWRERLTRFRRGSAWLVVVGLLGLPLLQIGTIFFYEETLSDSAGIERIYSEKFPGIINAHLARQNLSPLAVSDAVDQKQRLQSLSRQIIERGLLQRDLVLTGSCLAQTSADLPLDLYFYAATKSSNRPRAYGSRGIAIDRYPAILLDVMMGSGSIYPVFPSRTIEDFPRPSDSIELVDGAFAHNSPIEATVLWGASHIVLIQASPDERGARGSFFENSQEAFNHLYAQAQRIDAQTKEKVTVFTLSPQPPHICLLDFAGNLLEQAIEKGYREAGGSVGSSEAAAPSFRKELGEPRFFVPKAAATTPLDTAR